MSSRSGGVRPGGAASAAKHDKYAAYEEAYPHAYVSMYYRREPVDVRTNDGSTMTLVPQPTGSPDLVKFQLYKPDGSTDGRVISMTRFEFEHFTRRLTPAEPGSRGYRPSKPKVTEAERVIRAREAKKWSRSQAETLAANIRQEYPFLRVGTPTERTVGKSKSYGLPLEDRAKGRTQTVYHWRDVRDFVELRNHWPDLSPADRRLQASVQRSTTRTRSSAPKAASKPPSAPKPAKTPRVASHTAQMKSYRADYLRLAAKFATNVHGANRHETYRDATDLRKQIGDLQRAANRRAYDAYNRLDNAKTPQERASANRAANTARKQAAEAEALWNTVWDLSAAARANPETTDRWLAEYKKAKKSA